ncbi:MAG: 50S ribosomal protein L32 [Candidatus Pacebacteria bacterium]|nr:50S ribosomal protein L32 [Candidatus Paceibacterota bacterium]MCD8507968.1 50S ribosomal protein L32 [Candidatus Paceibacterota bacterium]MCD8564015.1 50S ribosomal protein L32 [Candidatus Paceibacterota bacterium]
MVIRMRHTRAHTRNRRAHHALSAPAITTTEAGVPHLRHRATKDGHYRGRQVLDVVAQAEKKIAKAKKTSK